jgi:hypothetical protein
VKGDVAADVPGGQFDSGQDRDWRLLSGYSQSEIAFQFGERVYLKSESNEFSLPTLVTSTVDGHNWDSIEGDSLAERLRRARDVSIARFGGRVYAHSSDQTPQNSGDVLRASSIDGQFRPIDWPERDSVQEIASANGELFVVDGRSIWRRSANGSSWTEVTPEALEDLELIEIQGLAGRLYAKVVGEDRSWVSADGGRNWSDLSTERVTNTASVDRWAVMGNSVVSAGVRTFDGEGGSGGTRRIRVTDGTSGWMVSTLESPVPFVRGSLAVRDGSLFALGVHTQLLRLDLTNNTATVVRPSRLHRRHAGSAPLLVAGDHFVTSLDRVTIVASPADEHWEIAPGREGRPDRLVAEKGWLWAEGDVVRMIRASGDRWDYPVSNTADERIVIDRVWPKRHTIYGTTTSGCILRLGRGDSEFHFTAQWVRQTNAENRCQTSVPTQQIGALSREESGRFWLSYRSTPDSPEMQGLARSEPGNQGEGFNWVDFNQGEPGEQPIVEDIVSVDTKVWVYADTTLEGYRELFTIEGDTWREQTPAVLNLQGENQGTFSIRKLWSYDDKLYAKVSTSELDGPRYRLAEWQSERNVFDYLPMPPDIPVAHTVDDTMGPMVATRTGISRFEPTSGEWTTPVDSLPPSPAVTHLATDGRRVYVAVDSGGIYTTLLDAN